MRTIWSSFAPPNICYDPVTVTLAVAAAGMQIYSGFEQKKALEKQAEQQERQAQLAKQEAEAEAARREEERDRFTAKQRMAFAANGIRVTPGNNSVLAVTNFTADQFNQEIAAIRRRGAAQQDFYETEAQISENKGRSAVLSGFTGAASTGANTAAIFA